MSDLLSLTERQGLCLHLFADYTQTSDFFLSKSLNRSPRLLLLQSSQIPGWYSRPGLYLRIYGKTLYDIPVLSYKPVVTQKDSDMLGLYSYPFTPSAHCAEPPGQAVDVELGESLSGCNYNL